MLQRAGDAFGRPQAVDVNARAEQPQQQKQRGQCKLYGLIIDIESNHQENHHNKPQCKGKENIRSDQLGEELLFFQRKSSFLANLYPRPRIVRIYTGCFGASSTLSRNLEMCTIMVLASS
ncbi:hypothetical protein D3C75_910030 [compost metagenome]